MLPQSLSRGQQSRLHLLCLRALNAPTGYPKNAEEAASAALAEAIAFYSNSAEFTLSEIFTLSDAIMFHRDENCKTPAAVFDMESLNAAIGSRKLALLAIRLCGAFRDDKTNDWRDGAGQATRIFFPPDFRKRILSV